MELSKDQIDRIEQNLSYISSCELEAMFDEYLNDISESSVYILGCCYGLAHALKSIDPMVYDQEFANWMDAVDHQDSTFIKVNGEYYYRSEVLDLLDFIEERLEVGE